MVKIALDDPNGSIYLNGDVNVASKVPTFNFLAVVNKVRPHDLNLTTKYPDAEFSLKLKANFTALELDNGLWSVVEFLHVKPGKGAAFS